MYNHEDLVSGSGLGEGPKKLITIFLEAAICLTTEYYPLVKVVSQVFYDKGTF